MKFFSLILSFYIVLLTAMPCADELPGPIGGAASAVSAHKTDGHHTDTDHCSPFCTCDCCATHVITVNYIVHLECSDFIRFEYSEFSVSYISSSFAAIWQPPEIA
jgi:hypothetical protein